MPQANAGYFRSGLPYNRFGRGPRPLVIFQGLIFENKPQSGLMNRMYNFLGKDYTAYSVLRKPGLPRGYSLADMADDYAVMIREEFGGPVDVIGVSTGGSIVQNFAADHPDLVRRLVIHSSAHTLCDAAKAAQMEVGRLASQRKWREAWAILLSFMLLPGPLARPQAWLAALILSLAPPKDPSDLIITIEAEDQFQLQGAPRPDRGADHRRCGRARSVLLSNAFPRDGRRHSRCQAHPVSPHGPSGFGQAVQARCARISAGGVK